MTKLSVCNDGKARPSTKVPNASTAQQNTSRLLARTVAAMVRLPMCHEFGVGETHALSVVLAAVEIRV